MSTFFAGKVKAKPGASGGLKKGGLKGLKAKKEAKEAKKKDEPAAAPAKEEPAKTPSPEVCLFVFLPIPFYLAPCLKQMAYIVFRSFQPAKSVSRESPVPSASASSSSSVDSKVVKGLQDEIKSLKDNEKKMQKDLKALTDKLKDYDKLTGDIKLLCDAVKKNDERITALESLVQEESEDEQ